MYVTSNKFWGQTFWEIQWTYDQGAQLDIYYSKSHDEKC